MVKKSKFDSERKNSTDELPMMQEQHTYAYDSLGPSQQ